MNSCQLRHYHAKEDDNIYNALIPDKDLTKEASSSLKLLMNYFLKPYKTGKYLSKNLCNLVAIFF